mgnify:CR=1 FL=1
MNKEKEVLETTDVSINKFDEDVNIEDILEEGWDISMYGSITWDHKKRKWVRKRFN